MNDDGYATLVREYLRDCRRAAAKLALQGSSLDPRYHPTGAGACKLIHHDGTSEATKIRAVFREMTEGATTKAEPPTIARCEAGTTETK